MTAHVAERGEGRGRVVLRLLGTVPPSEVAIEAAIRIAKAYHSEIESVVVTDRQIFDAAGYAFAREICVSRPSQGPIAVAEIARQIELAGRALQRRVELLAGQAEVPVLARVVEDTPVGALASACQVSGPWNVVALGEVATGDWLRRLDVLFERVTGMTGVLLAGPRSRIGDGPVVAVIEDIERLTGMLRAAERIARVTESEIVVAVVAETRAMQAWIEDHIRLATGIAPETPVVTLGRPGGGVAVAAEALRRLGAGFVIAEHGGILVPRDGDAGALLAAMESPLLVVR